MFDAANRASARRGMRWLVVVTVMVACADEPDRSPFDVTVSAGSIGSGPSQQPAADDEDRGSDSSGGSDSGEASGGGEPDPDGGSSPANTATTTVPGDDSGEGGSGDPVLDACLDLAVDDCQVCACNQCLDPLYACQQDPGCVAMRDCAEQTGCAGVDCLEPCGAVIDMYGGPFGASGALALALSDCLSVQCAICF